MEWQQPVNWHSETMKRFKSMSTESLHYVRQDARLAAIAGETINNPKVGQYLDEVHYANMELRKRGALT